VRRHAPKLVLFAGLLTVALCSQPSPEPSRVQPSGTPVIRWDELDRRTVEQARWNEAVWYASASTPPVVVSLPKREPGIRVQGYEGDVWWALALCESGGDPTKNTGNGFYGAFQFVLSTWRSLGYEGNPTEYSYETQREAAITLQARSGWSQWPACSRKLGLR